MFTTTRAFQIASAGSLVAILSLVLACGGDDGGSEPSATESTPSAQAPKAPAAPKAPVPAPKVTDKGLPDGFPSDIPLYPGAKSERSLGIPGGPTLAAFSSGDDVESVLSFYTDQLSGAGWEVSETGGQNRGIRASKDGRSVNIRVDARPEGTTNIAIVVSQS